MERRADGGGPAVQRLRRGGLNQSESGWKRSFGPAAPGGKPFQCRGLYLLDETVLAVHVRIHVVRMRLGQLPLQVRILAGNRRMGPQEVAERQMSLHLRRVLLKCMNL